MTSARWIEHLAPAESWRLLSLSAVGRIGLLVDGAPEIYPVNFAVDDESVVFRTDPGNKLYGIDRNPAVCFEADGLNFDDNTGWSVLVKGRAVEIAGDALHEVEQLPLHFWAIGAKMHWIRVIPHEVTGRRIHAA